MSHSIKSQRNEKSLAQFDYKKAVSNYLGTQSTFKGLPRVRTVQGSKCMFYGEHGQFEISWCWRWHRIPTCRHKRGAWSSAEQARKKVNPRSYMLGLRGFPEKEKCMVRRVCLWFVGAV